MEMLKEIYHYVPFWIWAILGWCVIYTVFIIAVAIGVKFCNKYERNDQNEDK